MELSGGLEGDMLLFEKHNGDSYQSKCCGQQQMALGQISSTFSGEDAKCIDGKFMIPGFKRDDHTGSDEAGRHPQ